jgi:hypothetical protein
LKSIEGPSDDGVTGLGGSGFFSGVMAVGGSDGLTGSGFFSGIGDGVTGGIEGSAGFEGCGDGFMSAGF